jgi:hypothetical protein
MNFEELKETVLMRAKGAKACAEQYKRALYSKNAEELIAVVKDNIIFNRNRSILTAELGSQYERPELFNAGKENCGDYNSGDYNSGYRNSGVFCTRKRKDFIHLFNRESSMTWDDWYDHPARKASMRLRITEWVSSDKMTESEKESHPKASVCGGYLKTYDYKEAWANLWEELTEEERESFKTLPNFDAEVFKEITGIYITDYR